MKTMSKRREDRVREKKQEVVVGSGSRKRQGKKRWRLDEEVFQDCTR